MFPRKAAIKLTDTGSLIKGLNQSGWDSNEHPQHGFYEEMRKSAP